MNELDDEIFKKAAAALPLVPYDESLTASIMQQVELDSKSASAKIAAPEAATPDTITQAQSTSTNASPGSTFDWRSASLMLFSFIAFVAFLPFDTGESAWSIASWAVALILLLVFKPLLAPPAKANGVKSYA